MKRSEGDSGFTGETWQFRRHLSEPFVAALEEAALNQVWWQEVLSDRDVIVALRNEYINVYYRGQSLFYVGFSDGRIVASTHPKYLIDPSLNGQVRLTENEEGENAFDVSFLKETMLTGWYDGALQRLKKAAAYFSGPEKTGCHAASSGRDDILDVEIAFKRVKDPAGGTEEARRQIPRIDLLRLVGVQDGLASLEFWEAKAFGNTELGSMGYRAQDDIGPHDVEREVIAQIADYRDILNKNAEAVVSSYRTACQQLVRIYAETERFGSNSIIGEIASGQRKLQIGTGDEARVNLLLFGFDDAQKARSQASFRDLERKVHEFGGGKLRAIGNAKRAFRSEGAIL